MAFTVWGLVTVVDADTFEVDDGSGPVHVDAPGHSLQTGDYAFATGLLDVSTNPWTLTCEARFVRSYAVPEP